MKHFDCDPLTTHPLRLPAFLVSTDGIGPYYRRMREVLDSVDMDSLSSKQTKEEEALGQISGTTTKYV